jgi:hypothetical protein
MAKDARRQSGEQPEFNTAEVKRDESGASTFENLFRQHHRVAFCPPPNLKTPTVERQETAGSGDQ